VLSEDQELATAVFQLGEFRLCQAFAQSGELGIGSVITDATRLTQEFPQSCNLSSELVEFKGRGELVCEAIPAGLIQIVLVLLGIWEPSLKLRKAPRPLCGGKIFEFPQQALLLFQPATDGFVDGVGRTGEAPLENGPSQSDALLLAPAGLRQKLVDVSRDRFVEVKLLAVQSERDGVGVPVGEEPSPLNVLEVFLQTAQGPRAVGTESKDLPADLSSPIADAMGLRK